MIARTHSSAFSLLSDFDREGFAVAAPSYEEQLNSAFDDGRRQGHAEGRAEAEADAEMTLTDIRVRHAEELSSEKDNWQRECADVLVAQLKSALELVERSIEERVAELLKPWLIERLRDRAVHDLERAISRSLVEGAKIHIEAPAEMIQHLRELLPPEGSQVGYSESATADVRAHIDETIIEANISTWVAELEAAVA
jgi:flagellar biosynthesis/type III secretory pathway protein FliH